MTRTSGVCHHSSRYGLQTPASQTNPQEGSIDLHRETEEKARQPEIKLGGWKYMHTDCFV
jgi:hypothetical protein